MKYNIQEPDNFIPQPKFIEPNHWTNGNCNRSPSMGWLLFYKTNKTVKSTTFFYMYTYTSTRITPRVYDRLVWIFWTERHSNDYDIFSLSFSVSAFVFTMDFHVIAQKPRNCKLIFVVPNFSKLLKCFCWSCHIKTPS